MSEPVEVMERLRAAAWTVAAPFFPHWEHRDDDVIKLLEVSAWDLRIMVVRADDPQDNAETLWEGGSVQEFYSRILREVCEE
ncbi:hypothetical protein GCM10023194_56830 [Planotetraspora phitsanulokensis]|uniref:Uncharacterized protein n=1 Tax=Planotetraspora phitsanulokensis TaxID=575192 RepID=A0A8J3XJC3_9ACTN|nr:hypothetical protein [Planotetraspora phitsanulokensis]GII43040.1 hypothetical protein Pph01_80430 [Planotetraspora phitsanulokensis]